MATSKQLNATQMRGLIKACDVIIPGDGQLPSFSRSGCLDHADRMLDYMTDFDLNGIRALLTVFAFLPKPMIAAILLLTEQHRHLPGPIAAACRMVNIGIKGIAVTLYYSDLGDGGPLVLPLLRWDSKIVERD